MFRKFDDIFENNMYFLSGFPKEDKNSLKRHYDLIDKINLSDNVPEEVRDLFDTAKNVLLYSFFSYDMRMSALLQATIAMEKSLKLFFDEPEKTLKPLLKKAIADEYVENKDFDCWNQHMARVYNIAKENKKMVTARLLTSLGATNIRMDFDVPEPTQKEIDEASDYDLLSHFVYVYVDVFRNNLAHGGSTKTHVVYDEFENIRDFINGLYKGE